MELEKLIIILSVLLIFNVIVVARKHWDALYVSLPGIALVGIAVFLKILEL